MRGEVLAEAESLARSLKEFDRSRALPDLALRFAEGGLQDEALATVGQIEPGRKRGEALVALAPHLGERSVRRALEAARQPGAGDTVCWAMRGLAPRLAALGFPSEALIEARSLPTGENRRLTLGALCPYLSKPERNAVLPEALVAARGIDREVSCPEEENERATAFAQLSPSLVELPSEVLLPVWSETMHTLASYIRRDVLADIQALTPLVLVLGGKTALIEAAQAVGDIGRWFP